MMIFFMLLIKIDLTVCLVLRFVKFNIRLIFKLNSILFLKTRICINSKTLK